jgi:hypothetical protein
MGPVPVFSLTARSPRQRAVITAAIIAAVTLALIALLSAAGFAPWDRHVPPHTVSVPLAGRQRAGLSVLSGATAVTVRTAALPGQLVRVSTPAGSGSVPDVVVSGSAVRVYLHGAGSGAGGAATVDITLSSAVAWRLRLGGGADRTAILLAAGRLRGADFSAGSSQITLRLPRPHGTVPIVLAGGADQVTITVPAGVAARLRLDGGASRAVLDGRAVTGIAGGTVLTGPGWASAASRYDIQAPAGVSVITVGTV